MTSIEPVGNQRWHCAGELRPTGRAATASGGEPPQPLGCEAALLVAVPNAPDIAEQLVWRGVERWGLDRQCVRSGVGWMGWLVRAAIAGVGCCAGGQDEPPSLLEISKTIYAVIEARVVLYGQHLVIEVSAPLVQPPGRSFLDALPEPRGFYPRRNRGGEVFAHTVWCGIATGRSDGKPAIASVNERR